MHLVRVAFIASIQADVKSVIACRVTITGVDADLAQVAICAGQALRAVGGVGKVI